MTGCRLLISLCLFWAAACGTSDRVVIGSKNFTEQIILGEILARQVERQTGLDVDRRFNLGGTLICHQALRAGEIDAYVEYTGTALKAVLGKETLRDREAVFRQVRAVYAEQGLRWLEPLGFNNTFAILIRGEAARRLGIRTLSEVAAYTPRWVAGFGFEFIERDDGFKGLVDTYGFEFAGPPRVMELGLIYRALAEGRVDFVAGDSTSGLITSLDLFWLEDDRHYFPPYDAAAVVRVETLERFPQLEAVLERLSGTISEELMQQMNFAVDGERKSAGQVADEFLARISQARRPGSRAL